MEELNPYENVNWILALFAEVKRYLQSEIKINTVETIVRIGILPEADFYIEGAFRIHFSNDYKQITVFLDNVIPGRKIGFKQASTDMHLDNLCQLLHQHFHEDLGTFPVVWNGSEKQLSNVIVMPIGTADLESNNFEFFALLELSTTFTQELDQELFHTDLSAQENINSEDNLKLAQIIIDALTPYNDKFEALGLSCRSVPSNAKGQLMTRITKSGTEAVSVVVDSFRTNTGNLYQLTFDESRLIVENIATILKQLSTITIHRTLASFSNQNGINWPGLIVHFGPCTGSEYVQID